MKLKERPMRQFARQHALSASLDRHHREYREPASFTATQVKNEFGRILEKAIQGQTVLQHSTNRLNLNARWRLGRPSPLLRFKELLQGPVILLQRPYRIAGRYYLDLVL